MNLLFVQSMAPKGKALRIVFMKLAPLLHSLKNTYAAPILSSP
ncbi:hypothetical protein [Veillonella seminalis]|nr:hypothetical protein [Veillonella seminalis]